MSTTVHVTNISPQTTQSQVQDFFSFCGKIQTLSLTPDATSQSAAVTFEKPTAAKTALLLDNTQLGPSIVHVTAAASLEELSSPKTSTAPASADAPHDVEQEDKPRSRILAEYLAHGYTVSDGAIQRAISLDQQHGISTRFTSALQNFDQKYKATEKADQLDKKYGVSTSAYQGWRGLNSYFERALGTPSGQKVRSFYLDGQKQVLDVHNEARRLADLKAGKHEQVQGETGLASAPVPGVGAQPQEPSAEAKERANLHLVEGTDGKRTACNCGGNEGGCPCEPGKCACSTCGKNPDHNSSAATGVTA